jgi:uncharacterized protein (DUF849 family)
MREVVIMVAPNGARKTRSDHSSLPVSIEDTVSEAALCRAVGASALHAHVRGANDEHVLDAGLYRELIAAMAQRVPGMLVQIISSGFEQPDFARQFFEWCDDHRVHVQHIVFSAEEFRHFLEYRDRGVIPAGHRCVLFVLGRYNVNFQSAPVDLEPFLKHDLSGLDWFTCAFGLREQECVMAAIEAGGNARIGFENNLHLPNGEIAPNTAALVTSLADAIESSKLAVADCERARQLLGIRSA